MRESALVVKLKGNGAEVKVVRGSHCGRCNLCQQWGERDYRLEVSSAGNVRVGDWVEVELEPSQVVSYSFLLFILPIIGLIVGYFWPDVFPFLKHFASQEFRILFAFLTLISVFGGLHLYDRTLRKKGLKGPRIVQVLNQE